MRSLTAQGSESVDGCDERDGMLLAVEGIMQQHGGAVYAQTRVGEGTVVTMLWPLLQDDPDEVQ